MLLTVLVLIPYKCMYLGGDENIPGTTICMFHELVECLVGMKVSIVTKADETCISAVHQSSGNCKYEFTFLNLIELVRLDMSSFLCRN